jgi:hypothetical protein
MMLRAIGDKVRDTTWKLNYTFGSVNVESYHETNANPRAVASRPLR